MYEFQPAIGAIESVVILTGFTNLWTNDAMKHTSVIVNRRYIFFVCGDFHLVVLVFG